MLSLAYIEQEVYNFKGHPASLFELKELRGGLATRIAYLTVSNEHMQKVNL
jgi:hypothetical protein